MRKKRKPVTLIASQEGNQVPGHQGGRKESLSVYALIPYEFCIKKYIKK